MNTLITEKIRQHFSSVAIYKDPASINSLFAGRNLPSFVKDFIIKKYINPDGSIKREELTVFLDKVIPQKQESVKDRLDAGEEIKILARFIIYIDLVRGVRRFAIPDLGIKLNEGQIPEYVYKNQARYCGEELGEGGRKYFAKQNMLWGLASESDIPRDRSLLIGYTVLEKIVQMPREEMNKYFADSSGLGNNGSIVGQINTTQDTISGLTSAVFSSNKYVRIPTLPDMEDLTVSFWFKLDSDASSYKAIFSWQNSPTESL